MPLYDYKCNKCGIIHELERKMDDVSVPLNCGECGGLCERIYSVPAVKVTGGASPSRVSGRSIPSDAIPLAPGFTAVPRRDKNGNLVKMKDLKGPGDLPKDMQKLWKSRQEKHHMIKEAQKK